MDFSPLLCAVKYSCSSLPTYLKYLMNIWNGHQRFICLLKNKEENIWVTCSLFCETIMKHLVTSPGKETKAEGIFYRAWKHTWDGGLLSSMCLNTHTVSQHSLRKAIWCIHCKSLASTPYGYSVPASRNRSQSRSRTASPDIRYAWKRREQGSRQSCRQDHTFTVASASRTNPSRANGLFPAGVIHLSQNSRFPSASGLSSSLILPPAMTNRQILFVLEFEASKIYLPESAFIKLLDYL